MFFSSHTLLGQDHQNLKKIPARYKIHGNTFYAVAILIFSFVFGAESIYVLATNYTNLFDQDVKHLIFGPISLLFLFWSLDQFIRRGSLIIDSETVECRYIGLLGKRHWVERISNYDGLKMKKEFGANRGVGMQTFYSIWLKHRNNAKSIRVYRAWSSDGWEEECRKIADLLALSALK